MGFHLKSTTVPFNGNCRKASSDLAGQRMYRYRTGYPNDDQANFHPDVNSIYRIVGDVRDKDGNVIFLNSPFREVAGIEHLIDGFGAKAAFHVFGSTISVPSANGRIARTYDSRQEGSYALSTILTSPDFFHLFPHVWLAGSPSVLDQPGRIVLAGSVARKYFGTDGVGQMLGRRVIYDDSLTLTVAGIVREPRFPPGHQLFFSGRTSNTNPTTANTPPA